MALEILCSILYLQVIKDWGQEWDLLAGMKIYDQEPDARCSEIQQSDSRK
jgi:hypothetical protein